MTRTLAALALPLMRHLDPERAHRLALLALRAGFAGRDPNQDPPLLAVEVLGRRFSNPIGLAAGFDKDAVALAPLMRLGFGFVEAGTVTPRPQPGNPRPRLFRLREDGAVINRMGMNGLGLQHFVGRLARNRDGPAALGANVGLNKDAVEPERDYASLVQAVGPYADYVALNVSSPNTPGLRDLQAEERLRKILDAIDAAVPSRPPLLVKIAPDLTNAAVQSIIETCVSHNVQGLIISNTTISRSAELSSRFASEHGGLSGRPLFAMATSLLARAYVVAAGRLVLIGCGGIASGRDALTKIRAGASLVQLYTSFAYEGPALLGRMKAELVTALRHDGFATIAEAVGVDAPVLGSGFDA